MKPATSNLANRWGLSKPIIKSHAEKSWRGPDLGELPNISATAEASDFKFGMLFGFSKAIIKLHPEE